MNSRWINWITWLNCGMLGLTLLATILALSYWLKRPSEIVCSGLHSNECSLPKGSFEQAEEGYRFSTSPLLALNTAPPTMQLPDLRQQVIYYGKNGRPDAQSERTMLHFALNGNNKAVFTASPKEKIYLFYDKNAKNGKYRFSEHNEKTSLWILGTPIDNEVQIVVSMENEKGEIISEPASFASFRLHEKEFNRVSSGASWEIGSYRVDGTLLARQKARWHGTDRFLEKHGGDDYQDITGKQRVDFGENEDIYSVFVKTGDCLSWDKNRWKVVVPGANSVLQPLMVVKKIDERLMNLELWDAEGKGKINLNLLKTTEPWSVQNTQTLQNMFKFLGSRTRTQCVFEINRERVILRPSDWLLLTSKGWKKLATGEEIDKYVKRQLSGTLFVFDGLIRKGEKQVMAGTLYSPARHECQPVELALQSGQKKKIGLKDIKEKETDKRGQ